MNRLALIILHLAPVIFACFPGTAQGYNNRLYLPSDRLSGAPGSYVDIPVIVDSGSKPLGSLSFDLCLKPPTGILQFVGPLGVSATGGALFPDTYTTSYGGGANMTVIAFNDKRPDASTGEHDALTLRFRIVGNAGSSCAIQFSNVAAWTTAAIDGTDGKPTYNFPIGVPQSALFTITQKMGDSLRLSLPEDGLKRNRLHPIKLVAVSQNTLGALDVTVSYRASVARIVDIQPNNRYMDLAYDRRDFSGGNLRLCALNRFDVVPRLQGTVDVATLWLDVDEHATASNLALGLTINDVYSGCGMDLVKANVSNSLATADIKNVSPLELITLAPVSSNVVWNSQVDIPVLARIGDCSPVVVAGEIHYDTNVLRLAHVEPWVQNPGAITIDTNAFATGTNRFLFSCFDVGDPITSPQRIMILKCQLAGYVYSTGKISVLSYAAADGVENGVDVSASRTADSEELIICEGGGDRDSDGMPDWWEHYRFNNPTSAWAGVDQDGDSLCNRDEYFADTDPNQGHSYFHIIGISHQPVAVIFSNSSPRRLYSLEYVNALTNPLVWNSVPGQTKIRGIGPTDSLVDTSIANHRFYRVKVTLP